MGQGGCAITLYADILIATNMLTDYFLLRLCAALRHRPVRRRRLLLASAAGGVSSLLILLDAQRALCLGASLAAGAVICVIAFGGRSLRTVAGDLLCLYAVGFAYSGVMYAIWLFITPRGMYWNHGYAYFSVSPLQFVLLTALTYGVLRLIRWRIDRAHQKQGAVIRLCLGEASAEAEGTALVDSGSLLTEPISGFPVIVADAALAAKASPPLAQYSESPNAAEAANLAAGRFRLVHFCTIDGGGLLPACQISRVCSPDAQLRPPEQLYVASCGGLRARTGYDAIVPRAAVIMQNEAPRSGQKERNPHASAFHPLASASASAARRQRRFLHKWRRHSARPADGGAGGGDHAARSRR